MKLRDKLGRRQFWRIRRGLSIRKKILAANIKDLTADERKLIREIPRDVHPVVGEDSDLSKREMPEYMALMRKVFSGTGMPLPDEDSLLYLINLTENLRDEYDNLCLFRMYRDQMLYIEQDIRSDEVWARGEAERKRREEGCFVVTACVENQGLAQSCPELRLVRHYRDSYLQHQPQGPAIIRQYYKVAPTLVARIKQRPDAHEIFADIYERHVLNIAALIEEGKHEQVILTHSGIISELTDLVR